MIEIQNEETFIRNEFGTVTTKRVTYFRKKGWFKGGSREDIPLKHVTSVRIEINRHIFWGIVFLMVGLLTLIFLIGVIFLFLGILFLWGSPRVVVNTAGGDLSDSKGWPWQRSAVERFVDALRKQLFKD